MTNATKSIAAERLAGKSRSAVRPKLSVIINSYNYAAYIRQTIESVISQDYPEKEIIIVDDGSRDASPDIIREYSDRATVIIQENQGQATACLGALKYATGDYVQFLDSDDFLAPGALSKIAAQCSPSVAKIQFQLLPVGPSGETVGPAFPASVDFAAVDPRMLINKSGIYPCPPNSGNVYRIDVFDYIDKIEYDPSIDGIPLLLAPFLGRVVQIDEPLGFYRIHARNYSRFARQLTDYSNLNTSKLRSEANRNISRLEHLVAIAEKHNLPGLDLGAPSDLLVVVEREFLAEVADGRAPSTALLARYCRAVTSAPKSLGHRIAFILWALLIAVMPVPARKQLAIARINPHARWNLLRRLHFVR